MTSFDQRRQDTRRSFVACLALLGFFTAAAPAQAQPGNYPNRPVRLVVPFAPGGPADVLGRAIAQRLAEKWGQPVVIDNKAGANTNIAAADVARSAPDGYTLFMPLDATYTMNPALYSKLPFDPAKDFAPISIVAKQFLVLTANEKTNVKTVAELVSTVKARPGEFSYAFSTTSTQLSGVLFTRQTGTKFLEVPYKGASDVLKGMLSADVQFAFDGIAANVPHIKSGKIRALATTGARRSAALPDVPTMAEAGLKGYEVEMWNGLAAPAGTPPAIIEKISRDVAEVVKRQDVRDQLSVFGFEMVGSTPLQMADSIRMGSAKYLPLIREIGLKIE
jgi:tripartite-type tricarboxylate transporter receptor subunit TctC